jgi:hypothetical protein
MMKIATLEFSIKRAKIDRSSLESDQINLIDMCVDLCNKKQHIDAVNLIKNELFFEWAWSNCDGDINEISDCTDDLSLNWNDGSFTLKISNNSNNLIITATTIFEISVNDNVVLDELNMWLDDNSAYACGYIGGGWSYTESDGDNVLATTIR